jgi:hypothetical protein
MSDEVVVEITESQVVEVLLAEGPRGLQGVQGATGLTGADSSVVGPQGVQGETGPAVDTTTLEVEQSQVAGLVSGLAGKAGLTGATFTGNISARKFLVGLDLSLIPVSNGQTAITSWWGLQLSGNRQSSVDYIPENIGGAGVAHVVVPLSKPASVGMLIRGAAGQTANLQEWQNSAGTVRARVDANGNLAAEGRMYLGVSATSLPASTLGVTTGNTSVVGSIIRGAAGQTANLQEWQDSAGTAVAKVDATGKLTAANFLQGTGSPLGVVSANVGAIYVDTASTMGASTWQKMSGTGTSGWVVTVGDTGVRNMTPATTLSGYGAFRIQRIGNVCELILTFGIAASSGDLQILTSALPVGFRPGNSRGIFTTTRDSILGSADFAWNGGALTLLGATSGKSISLSFTYITPETWPLTFPS